MKIKSIRLSRLRNAEHYQYQSEFNDLVIKATSLALGIESLFPSFQARFMDEGIAMNVILKSMITDELVDSDNIRDNTFRGLFDLVKSGTNHFDADTKQAAERVMLVIDEPGNIATKPYNEETAIITTVIDKLRTDHADDLTTLSATAWVDELEAKNNAFEELAKSRYTHEAGKTTLRMKEVRLDVDAVYRKIIQLINALILVNGEAAYSDFVNELNERIDKFNLTLAQREGRNVAV